MSEDVILVDENDNQIGLMEKMETHEKGLLHRCFSILVFNKDKKVLVHQRALDKYHCGGLWTNTCCSHQRDGESTLDAAHRRLEEELGFTCELEEQFTFIYKAAFDNGLTEHEFDHVLFGTHDGDTNPNPQEVADTHWMTIAQVKKDIATHPKKYTPWFKIIIEEIEKRELL